MCLCKAEYPKRLYYNFLKELQTLFAAKVTEQLQEAAIEYSLEKVLLEDVKKAFALYNSANFD